MQEDTKTVASQELQHWREINHILHTGFEPIANQILNEVQNRIESALSTTPYEIKPTSTYFRYKSWKSALPKIEEGRPVWRLTDLLGSRIIVKFETDVSRARAAILADASLRTNHPPDNKRWLSATGRKAGYSGVHLQIRSPLLEEIDFNQFDSWTEATERLAGTNLPSGMDIADIASRFQEELPVELQIRTDLQHSWAELSHGDFYKGPYGITSKLQERLVRLAASLDVIGDEIVALKLAVDKLEKPPLANLDWNSNEFSTTALDEHALLVVSSLQLRGPLEEIRTLAVKCGFRESGWPENVRPGHEVDTFLPFAHSLGVRSVGDFQALCTDARNFGDELQEIANDVETQTKDHPFGNSLFARPLYVLSIVLMLKNPPSVCRGFSPEISRALVRAAARLV